MTPSRAAAQRCLLSMAAAASGAVFVCRGNVLAGKKVRRNERRMVGMCAGLKRREWIECARSLGRKRRALAWQIGH